MNLIVVFFVRYIKDCLFLHLFYNNWVYNWVYWVAFGGYICQLLFDNTSTFDGVLWKYLLYLDRSRMIFRLNWKILMTITFVAKFAGILFIFDRMCNSLLHQFNNTTTLFMHINMRNRALKDKFKNWFNLKVQLDPFWYLANPTKVTLLL